MNAPLTRRDAIYAQLFDDVDALTTRVEGLGPHLDSLGDKLLNGLEHYDRRIAELTAEAQANAMTYIVRRTKETADASVRDQVISIEAAVGTLFDEKIAPRLVGLAQAVEARAERPVVGPARPWLLHGAIAFLAAATASIMTAVAFVVVMPVPGK